MAVTKETTREAVAPDEGLVRASSGAGSIATQLRKAILESAYSYGERLPAERELALHYRASRSTVREALRQLEDDGLVSRKIGSGTFVSYRLLDEAPFGESEIVGATSPLELIEVRLAVEPRMASSAVLHATARDLQRLGEALAQLEACGADRDAFTKADEHFHMCLAECTKNKLMIWLYRHINSIRTHEHWGAMKDKIVTPENIKAYNRYHRELYEAICRRDRAKAVESITAHMELAHRHLVGASGI